MRKCIQVFAFNCNVRRYTKAAKTSVNNTAAFHGGEALKINYANDRDAAAAPGGGGPGGGGGRGLHSFTSQLNLIHFSHTSPCPPV